MLKAAAAPGWVRARTALLAAFWLGWLGMLGAAAAIVARAPRCHVTGSGADWWRRDGVYRAPPEVFGSVEGLRSHLDYVASLAGGLLLGPLPNHNNNADPPLDEWPPHMGSEEELGGVLGEAKEKGLKVLVELKVPPQGPPNANHSTVLKRAIGAWLQRGFHGVFLDDIGNMEPTLLDELRNMTEQWDADGTPRLLMGGTRLRDPPSLEQLLNRSGVPLLMGVLPLGPPHDPQTPPPTNPEAALEPPHIKQLLRLSRGGAPIVWSLGTPWSHAVGLSPPLTPQVLLLLWGGLPNAPIINYGDEVGLVEPNGAGTEQLTPMPWKELEALQEGGNSTKAQLLTLSRRLRKLREKEEALAVGDAELLWAGPQSGIAILRGGVAGERFLLLLNPGAELINPFRSQPDVATPTSGPTPSPLPPSGHVVLSTHRPPPNMADPPVKMAELQLLPHEGLILRLPHK